MPEAQQQLGGHDQQRLDALKYARSVATTGKYDDEATQLTRVVGGVANDVKRTFEKMCDDHNVNTEKYMADIVRPHLAAQKTIIAPHAKHVLLYQPNQVDQSTVDVFGGLNLDTRTMTNEQEKALRNHDLLKDDERKLPRYQLVSLLKVKMLDFAAALKDKEGPRPVNMSYPNPASYNIDPKETYKSRLARQQATAPTQSPFVQYKSPQPEKKGLLRRFGSGIVNAASKLKFW
jgi:hypothetical protein